MQKIISRFLIPLLTVWFVCQPVLATAGAINTLRVGSSYYPVTAQGAMSAAVDIAALAGRANPWVLPLTVGYHIGKYVVEGLDSSGAVVPMNVLPASMTQMPAANQPFPGYVYDSVTKTWVPLSTASQSVGYSHLLNQSVFTDAQSACNNLSTIFTIENYGSPMTFILDSVTQRCSISGPQGPITSYTIHSISSCPVGYTLANSVCNLSNAALVKYPSDGVPTIVAKADGSGFVLDSKDPDNSLAPVSIPSVIQSSGVVGGQNTRITIEPQTGGGLRTTTEQEVINSDASKSTFKQVVVVNNLGKVTNSTSANYPGSIPDQTSTTQASSPSTLGIEFPTDYNRETTQTAMQAELAGEGENSDLTGSTETASAQIRNHYDSHKDAQDIQDAMSGSALPSLPGFLFPSFSSPACHPIGWIFQGREVAFNICPHVPTIKSIFGWVLNLIAAAMMFQMIMNFRAMRVRG